MIGIETALTLTLRDSRALNHRSQARLISADSDPSPFSDKPMAADGSLIVGS